MQTRVVTTLPSINLSTSEDEEILAGILAAKLRSARNALAQAIDERDRLQETLKEMNDNIAGISKTISTILFYQKEMNLPEIVTLV